jgi:hypothetical protein
MNTKQKFALLVGIVVLWVAAPASAQFYTYPGKESGCLCYGPPIDLEECRSVYGLGIPVQTYYNPSTNNTCGAEGETDYGHTVLGVDIQQCCIQHDLDWSTCNKPRWESDSALGSCVSNACNEISPAFHPVEYIACKIAARAIQTAVSIGPKADKAYRSSIEKTCACSPCGLESRLVSGWFQNWYNEWEYITFWDMDCLWKAGPDWVYKNGPLWDDGDCKGCRHNPWFPFFPWWPGFGSGSTLEEKYRTPDEEKWARFIDESYETDEERARFAALPSVEELLAGRTALVKAMINDGVRLVPLIAGTCAFPFGPDEVHYD